MNKKLITWGSIYGSKTRQIPDAYIHDNVVK